MPGAFYWHRSYRAKHAFEASLKAEGCLYALVIWGSSNILLDGHNRYEICGRLNIPFQTIERAFESREEAKIWIINNQFARRNLYPFQRAQLALIVEPLMKAKANELMRQGALRRQEEIRQLRSELAGTVDSDLVRISNTTLSKLEFW